MAHAFVSPIFREVLHGSVRKYEQKETEKRSLENLGRRKYFSVPPNSAPGLRLWQTVRISLVGLTVRVINYVSKI